MPHFMSRLSAAAVLGQLVGQFGWIDALFIPLVLLAPVVSGAVAASRRLGYAWVAVLWFSAGTAMLWSDWLVNREDVIFHLVLSVVMPLLAAFGFGVVALASKARRRPA